MRSTEHLKSSIQKTLEEHSSSVFSFDECWWHKHPERPLVQQFILPIQNFQFLEAKNSAVAQFQTNSFSIPDD